MKPQIFLIEHLELRIQNNVSSYEVLMKRDWKPDNTIYKLNHLE